VPGVDPQPGEAYGQVRQDLCPHAKGGPVINMPPGQRGFGQELQAAGWLRGGAQLTYTLSRLGVPPGSGSRPALAGRAGSRPGRRPARPSETGSYQGQGREWGMSSS